MTQLDAHRVVEQAAVHVAPVQLGRRDRHVQVAAAVPVLLPDVVRALERGGDPPEPAFAERNLHPGELVEDVRKQERHHRRPRAHGHQERRDRLRCIIARFGSGPRRPDVRADHLPMVLHRGPERVPCAVEQRRQPERRRVLGKAHGAGPERRGAFDLRDTQRHIPQRHDHHRYLTPGRVGTPFAEHEIVVGLHARERERAVACLQEACAGEAGKGREAQLSLHTVEVHVGGAVLRRVAAGADRVVAQRVAAALVDRNTGDAHTHRLCDEGAVEQPGFATRGEHPTEIVGERFGALDHTRRVGPPTRRQARRPQVRGFEQMVVDRDVLHMRLQRH